VSFRIATKRKRIEPDESEQNKRIKLGPNEYLSVGRYPAKFDLVSML
jgi:hypothetical protein